MNVRQFSWNLNSSFSTVPAITYGKNTIRAFYLKISFEVHYKLNSEILPVSDYKMN